MAEFQVEIAFTLEGRERDVDLLERFGTQLEAIAGDMGPATAIEGERYVAMTIVDANGMLEAAGRAFNAVIEALRRALAETGEELDLSQFQQRSALHVDPAELVPA